MIDILFIHPNASHKIYQDLAKDHSAIEPPIWAGMLCQHCLNKGYSAEIIDCESSRITCQQVIETINYLKPLIICIVVYGQQPSASTQNMEGAIKLAEEIKTQIANQFIVMVGGHSSALPDLTLIKHLVIDAVCTNEGVYTISDLIQCFKNNGNLKDVSGLRYSDSSGRIIYNKPSNIVKQNDLEHDLPNISWNKLPSLTEYRTAGWHSWTNNTEKSPFAALYTSLGCPFNCSFCCINTINGTENSVGINKFRYWKPEHTIKQFDYFAEQGVKNIKIADELFVFNKNHFLPLCQMIIERKYNFNIWCYARIDTCKQEYLDILKNAGVNWIGLGIESANKMVRQEVTKGKFTDINIKNIVEQIHKSGIEIGANYIFGLPEDTYETMQETLNFAIELNTSMANFYVAMAYPGSRLYMQTKKQDLPNSYSGYSQHSYDCKPLSSKYLASKEILEFRDDAWYKYHNRPEYLSKIIDKFGTKAYTNIIETCNIQLKRKLLGD